MKQRLVGTFRSPVGGLHEITPETTIDPIVARFVAAFCKRSEMTDREVATGRGLACAAVSAKSAVSLTNFIVSGMHGRLCRRNKVFAGRVPVGCTETLDLVIEPL